MTTLAQQIIRGELPPPPIAQLNGIVLVEAEPGRAVMRFEVTERHANPSGALAGGALCDLVDLAMGVAYAEALGDITSVVTVELKINFLRPVRRGTLTAEARLLNAGRTLGLLDCDVTDERGRLIAHATSTYMTLSQASSESPGNGRT
ncbi:MAG: PaaI family thioesterase [Dehalococcoidia bacterium]